MNPTLSEYQRRLDLIACRLMLAYMEPDKMDRALQVWAVEEEAGLDSKAFAIASMTAWQASLFWRNIDPDLGRKLLEKRLTQLEAP